ncbi:MAG: hypothetical protein J6P60_04215 [Lachnospiraceae bacterium]|nr:hypothetical protein [Lachnospiraceae bacterium]
MSKRNILPFYMTYPPTGPDGQESTMWEDLEYLQQMYPMGAKIVQNEINKTINTYDYRGSLIYDQYPDRRMLYKIAGEVLTSMRENRVKYQGNRQYLMLLEWEGIEEFITVLLFYEILRRRHHNLGSE